MCFSVLSRKERIASSRWWERLSVDETLAALIVLIEMREAHDGISDASIHQLLYTMVVKKKCSLRNVFFRKMNVDWVTRAGRQRDNCTTLNFIWMKSVPMHFTEKKKLVLHEGVIICPRHLRKGFLETTLLKSSIEKLRLLTPLLKGATSKM